MTMKKCKISGCLTVYSYKLVYQTFLILNCHFNF
jgi:hypothetical protein